jgi:hypothetical protein
MRKYFDSFAAMSRRMKDEQRTANVVVEFLLEVVPDGRACDEALETRSANIRCDWPDMCLLLSHLRLCLLSPSGV